METREYIKPELKVVTFSTEEGFAQSNSPKNVGMEADNLPMMGHEASHFNQGTWSWD